MKTKKIYKRLFILGIAIYLIYIFANQQKTLNSYKTAQQYYTEQIEAKVAYKESLYDTKNNISTIKLE